MADFLPAGKSACNQHACILVVNPFRSQSFFVIVSIDYCVSV